MRTKLLALSLFLWLILVAPLPILADTTYTYTGNPFTTIVGSPGVTTSDYVSISFSLTSPLASNLPLGTDVTSLPGFSLLGYTDGVHGYPTYSVISFSLSTDASGDIESWVSNVRISDDYPGNFFYVASMGGPAYPQLDQTRITDVNCSDDPCKFGDYAEVSGQQGAWSSSVPEPSSLILLGTGLAGLVGTARRKLIG